MYNRLFSHNSNTDSFIATTRLWLLELFSVDKCKLYITLVSRLEINSNFPNVNVKFHLFHYDQSPKLQRNLSEFYK